MLHSRRTHALLAAIREPRAALLACKLTRRSQLTQFITIALVLVSSAATSAAWATPISDKYAQLGGAAGFLGQPTIRGNLGPRRRGAVPTLRGRLHLLASAHRRARGSWPHQAAVGAVELGAGLSRLSGDR